MRLALPTFAHGGAAGVVPGADSANGTSSIHASASNRGYSDSALSSGSHSHDLDESSESSQPSKRPRPSPSRSSPTSLSTMLSVSVERRRSEAVRQAPSGPSSSSSLSSPGSTAHASLTLPAQPAVSERVIARRPRRPSPAVAISSSSQLAPESASLYGSSPLSSSMIIVDVPSDAPRAPTATLTRRKVRDVMSLPGTSKSLQARRDSSNSSGSSRTASRSVSMSMDESLAPSQDARSEDTAITDDLSRATNNGMMVVSSSPCPSPKSHARQRSGLRRPTTEESQTAGSPALQQRDRKRTKSTEEAEDEDATFYDFVDQHDLLDVPMAPPSTDMQYPPTVPDSSSSQSIYSSDTGIGRTRKRSSSISRQSSGSRAMTRQLSSHGTSGTMSQSSSADSFTRLDTSLSSSSLASNASTVPSSVASSAPSSAQKPFGPVQSTRLPAQLRGARIPPQLRLAISNQGTGRLSPLPVQGVGREFLGLLEGEYRESIREYMYEMEDKTQASVELIDLQPELEWHMRPFLVDFLIEIHQQCRLRPETLYLTMNIVDRYVSKRIVLKKHYQLVGCSALWIAAKFEDAKDRVPTVQELSSMCCRAYDESAFIQMEGHVLSTIGWVLGHPTAESWIRMACVADNTVEEQRIQHVARFLLETTLYHKDFISFKASDLAAAALMLARFMFDRYRRVEDETEAVLSVAYLMDLQLGQALDRLSATLIKKYAPGHYSRSSTFVREWFLSGRRFSHRGWAQAPEVLMPRLSPTLLRCPGLASASSGSWSSDDDVPRTPQSSETIFAQADPFKTAGPPPKAVGSTRPGIVRWESVPHMVSSYGT